MRLKSKLPTFVMTVLLFVGRSTTRAWIGKPALTSTVLRLATRQAPRAVAPTSLLTNPTSLSISDSGNGIQLFAWHHLATTTRLYSMPPSQPPQNPTFRLGDPVQVEVVSFGRLGATVEVIGLGHDESTPLLSVDEEPYGIGLVLQSEIALFRQARGNVDVVRGEVLPAYVQNIREEDGKLDISLRKVGGKAKSDDVGSQIMERLSQSPDGTIPVGDKSSPADIAREFPGVSKGVFKKAVGALYKKGLVVPSPTSIALQE